MLGMADGWVAAGYVLSILSSVLCIVYGAIAWNKGEERMAEADRRWIQEEDKIEKET